MRPIRGKEVSLYMVQCHWIVGIYRSGGQDDCVQLTTPKRGSSMKGQRPGELPERFKGTVLKTVVAKTTVGSNPTLSAISM